MAFVRSLQPGWAPQTSGLSLPHSANGWFKAMISCDPVSGFGPGGAAGGRYRRPPARLDSQEKEPPPVGGCQRRHD